MACPPAQQVPALERPGGYNVAGNYCSDDGTYVKPKCEKDPNSYASPDDNMNFG